MAKTSDVFRKIYLHGSLGKKYGKKPFKVAVNNTAQAFQAMCFRFEDFQDDCLDLHELHFVVKYKDGSHDAVEQPFMLNTYDNVKELHIVPKVQGSGTGAEIVVFGVVFTGVAAVVVQTMIAMAVSLAIGAVVSALSPKPKASGGMGGKASLLFTGAALYSEPNGAQEMHFGEVMANGTIVGQSTSPTDITIYE